MNGLSNLHVRTASFIQPPTESTTTSFHNALAVLNGAKNIIEYHSYLQTLKSFPCSQSIRQQIINIFTEEFELILSLKKEEFRELYDEILYRWIKNFNKLKFGLLNEKDYECFIEQEIVYFNCLRQKIHAESIDETKTFLKSKQPNCFEAYQTLVQTLNIVNKKNRSYSNSSEFKTITENFIDFEGFIIYSIKERKIKDYREECLNAFLKDPRTLSHHASLCKRIERIYQSTQNQLSIPDTQGTLGKEMLEDLSDPMIWEAFKQEVHSSIIGQLIALIQKFKETKQSSLLDLAAIFYEKLSKNLKKKLRISFSKDEIVLNETQNKLLEYITKGPLSAEIDFDPISNPDINCLFFSIKDNEDQIVGHIIGSIHLLPKDYAKLPKHIQKTFQESQVFMLEDNMLDRFGSANIKIIISKFHQDGLCAIDCEYASLAHKLRKRIISLDTEAATRKVINFFPQLNTPVTEAVSNTIFSIYSAAMQSGDLASIEPLLTDLTLDTDARVALLDSRNELHARSIDQFLRKKSSKEKPFIMIGVLHLVSSSGVLALLQSLGWRIEQVFAPKE